MSSQRDYPCLGSALALLRIPFVFTQDDLLSSGDFVKKAKERGLDLKIEDLAELHRCGLFLPLYRVSRIPVEGRRIEVRRGMGENPHGWMLDAAAEGRLRDSADEGYSVAWPYQRPPGEDPRRWWNGFIYSSWQLLHVRDAMDEYRYVRRGHLVPLNFHKQRVVRRRVALVLAALATHYFPAVVGKLKLPPLTEWEELQKARAASDVAELLRVTGSEPADLARQADRLLVQAHREPLAKWLSLLRYASYDAWSRLRGEPLDAMWRRIAAEILLRAHEDLAVASVVDPLPDLTGARVWTAQHDRLTPRYQEASTLERALADLGLSPYPKVILLVEGETELCHIPRLLAEIGMTQPQDVRVQQTKSSRINAHLIARYGITPRIGRRIDDRWLLDASLTALAIAMDPENDFATQVDRDKIRRNLQQAIREEVRHQEADIGDDVLDALVHVRVWGDDKYELANFSDDELVSALTTLAVRQNNQLVSSPSWERDLRAKLQEARAVHADIKVPMGRLRIREDKVELAELLWPALFVKCQAEIGVNEPKTPVLKVVLEVEGVASKVAGVRALLDPAGL
ncbi:hypothetical protein [Kibdelosporangium philippinense]|uniref:hypothetical protein n=1 Tax=Kibdelosporangium philippinense TaxID=211113 RepID=UPI00361E5987